MIEKVSKLPSAIKTPHKNSTMETVEITLTTVNGWSIPPFQRPLRVNDKVRLIAGQIQDDGGVVPGVITVGRLRLGREIRSYLIDGQHRLEAFRMSSCQQALADVRFMDFDTMVFDAWGRDDATKRLWGALNLSLCMWLWRRLVLDTDRRGTRRYIALRTEQFVQCLMSLGAAATYTDWVEGRQLGDRDRPAAYMRIKQIFARRLLETKAVKAGAKVLMPQPAWVKG